MMIFHSSFSDPYSCSLRQAQTTHGHISLLPVEEALTKLTEAKRYQKQI
jgi:hypothetical protein